MFAGPFALKWGYTSKARPHVSAGAVGGVAGLFLFYPVSGHLSPSFLLVPLLPSFHPPSSSLFAFPRWRRGPSPTARSSGGDEGLKLSSWVSNGLFVLNRGEREKWWLLSLLREIITPETPLCENESLSARRQGGNYCMSQKYFS